MLLVNKNIKIHFIGIGGIGMSGIAEVLLSLGYRVSGSDIADSPTVEKLRGLGAEVYIGHRKENINDVTVIVYSSAIDETNPEVSKSREQNIPIMRRAEMLAELMKLKHGVAIAGTHGKTTTTSFLATIVQESGIDPTYIIGGVVSNLGGHAKVGEGDILVAEADESDGSFLLLNPIMSVITNIDLDHMNYYETEENLVNSFLEFANKVPFYGCCALNAHDERLMSLTSSMKKPWITFGLEDVDADIQAKDVVYSTEGAKYQLYYNGEFKSEIKISLPGKHNVLNSLGAIAMASNMGISFENISESIGKFEGIGRRFQLLYSKNKFEIIDDYAHHPTEINSTLQAVKETRPDKKIVVVFEPHRYTRTKECWNDFFHCFNFADELVLCPIYPASEQEIPGITSERLASDLNKIHPDFSESLSCVTNINQVISNYKNENVTLVTLGAGSIGKNIRMAITEL